MKLVFDIVKSGKNAPKKRSFSFDNKDGIIGRSESCDWILTDQNSYISGHHISILFKHGSYFIKDESTNGTFLKNPYKRLPKGQPVQVNASDVFIIGDHELQARYTNNDYTQDDIISTVTQSDSSIDNIIPDDFLFDSDSSDFASIDSQEPSDMDVMSMLETQIPSSHSDEPFMEIPVEEVPSQDGDADLLSFFNERKQEHIIDADIDTGEDIFEEHISVPSYTKAKAAPQPVRPAPVAEVNGLAASIFILESKLGIEINSLAQEDRDAMMAELGDIVVNSLESLKNSLHLKDKTKQDLRLSTTHLDIDNNNPAKLGKAASKLLQSKDNMLGMMKISDAITKSFNELDAHCISLHSSSKNVMRIAASKFAPKNLEYRFEANGSLRGVLPKQQLLWKAYVDMFDVLNDRPEEGVEMIREDFTKEYENISYSLKLSSYETRQRV